MNIRLGTVGHFGLSVRDPEKTAAWWTELFDLTVDFTFDEGVAVSNASVTIAFHRGVPHPGTLGHMSFHLEGMEELRSALARLREAGVDLEDPGDEIGQESPGSRHAGLWFRDPDGYRWELSVQNGFG